MVPWMSSREDSPIQVGGSGSGQTPKSGGKKRGFLSILKGGFGCCMKHYKYKHLIHLRYQKIFGLVRYLALESSGGCSHSFRGVE